MSNIVEAPAGAGAQQARGPAAGRSRHRGLALGLILLAQLLVVVDVSIVTLALPTIGRTLSFSPAGLQWVISGYALAFGGFLLLGGRLADLLGRRAVLITGSGLFTVASLTCGLARSAPMLVAARAAEGLGVALMAPAALSLILAMFPEGGERNTALGAFGAVSGAGGAIGVLAGGMLTTWLSWPWIFFVNLPAGALIVAAARPLLPESRGRLAHRRFDVAGAVTIASGLSLLVYAVVMASSHGWASATTIGLLAGAAVLVAAFTVIEARSAAPLLPLSFFRNRDVPGANLAGLPARAERHNRCGISMTLAERIRAVRLSPDLPGVSEVPVVDPRVACRQALGAGLIVRRARPLNAETPLAALTGGGVVPNDRFYVRNHFHIPDLVPATWRLRVGGLAERPMSFSLADLRAMASETAVVTLECAGNGRSGLVPPVPGEQWGLGAVGTAAWTGVPLTEVLALAAPLPGAREVVFRGADSGPVEGRAGLVAFERSLPLGYPGLAQVLLAHAMNGSALPAVHGFPLRLIVPGWYGVASVKWLTNIELTDRGFAGHFQVDRYRIGGRLLTVQAVRSLITEPRPGEALAPGEVVIGGLAWSGAAPIAKVEVSIADQPWQQAALTGGQRPSGWQRWQLAARLEEPGSLTVRARATDLAGRTQPDQPRWNLLGYATNPVHKLQVSVGTSAAQTS